VTYHPPQTRFLRQNVKPDSARWILGGDLDEASTHPRHRNVVVEEDGARIGRIDARSLQARFREDRHLRFHRNVARIQQRPQIPGRSIERQSRRAREQTLIQLRHGILPGRDAVADRRVPARRHPARKPPP
jgi:hypothetical protein